MVTIGQPAASADAGSPPATEMARGKLLAPKITTGPTGTNILRRSGLGNGSLSGIAVSILAPTQSPSSATLPKTLSCITVLPNSPSSLG